MSLSPEIIRQIRMLELKAGHLVNDALAGNYLSAFKGRGMEFDEVREYVPGDDIRTIDWNVTARMQAPYVKVHREERELTLILMVDVSPSQGFGSNSQLKRELAAELAAVLAFLAIRNNDKVGLVVFSDHIEHFILPQKGRAHVWNIIRSVLTHDGKGRGTDIAGALNFMLQLFRRRAMVFLISDFWASHFDSRLRLAARRHDLICARTVDPKEQSLADGGMVSYQDAETGTLRMLNTSLASVRKSYQQAINQHEDELKALFARTGVDSFQLTTGEPVVQSLMKYLRSRLGKGIRKKRITI